MLVLSALLVPLSTALTTALLSGFSLSVRRGVSLGGAFLTVIFALRLLWVVETQGPLTLALGGWPLPFAIAFSADRLSAAMVLVTAILGAAVLIHQAGDADPAPESATLHPLIHGLLAAAGAAFVTADLFNLYVWFELMLVATLGLLVHGKEPRHLQAAFTYLLLNLVGTLIFLMALSFILGAAGHLNFSALREAAKDPALSGVMPLYVTVLILALLLKAGAFPLFFWLPASYHTLPAPLLALVGGLVTKVAVYALLRLSMDVFTATPPVLFEALGVIALFTMVTGGLGAVHHWDLRRILSFHIVSQIGYLLMGVALSSPAGTAGTLFFTLHNILAKAGLFLFSGIVFAVSGHHDLRRIGDLQASRPGLALLFLLCASALVGVPPLSGFWGKYLLVREAFSQERWIWGAVALAVSLLTLYSMVKIGMEAFWKPRPTIELPPAEPSGLFPTCGALALLTALMAAMGLFPESFIRYAMAAAADLGAAGGLP